jgi:hypothetical protein
VNRREPNTRRRNLVTGKYNAERGMSTNSCGNCVEGPFILDANDCPVLATHEEYAHWVKSLQASEEWRWGGKAFETIFVLSEWLPAGIGSITTMFEPYAPVDSRGPKVFQTSVNVGKTADGRFVDVGLTRIIKCVRYHTREEAIQGHRRLMGLVSAEGIESLLAADMQRSPGRTA